MYSLLAHHDTSLSDHAISASLEARGWILVMRVLVAELRWRNNAIEALAPAPVQAPAPAPAPAPLLAQSYAL